MPMNIAFIPIRKGSKGVPGKNMKPLAGKPLTFWIVDTLLASKCMDEIWLAVDSDDYARLALERYGSKVNVVMRSAASATDKASVMTVVKEFLQRRKPADDDWVCLFQTTSPFTSVEEIEKLATLIRTGKYNSVVACVRMRKFRWSDDGKPLDYDLITKPRRQDYHGWLVESGAFYASNVVSLKKSPYILSGDVGIVETGIVSCIEIDEKCDWAMAEGLAKMLLGSDQCVS